MIPAPLTDEQREQLQARITETLRGIQTAFEAIAQAMTNAAKGFASSQAAFELAPPPEDPHQCWRVDPHPPHMWTWRPEDGGVDCPGRTEPKEPTT